MATPSLNVSIRFDQVLDALELSSLARVIVKMLSVLVVVIALFCWYEFCNRVNAGYALVLSVACILTGLLCWVSAHNWPLWVGFAFAGAVLAFRAVMWLIRR
jgi:hypothetical protein